MENNNQNNNLKYIITFSEEIFPKSELRQINLSVKDVPYLTNHSHEVYESKMETEEYIYLFEGFFNDGFLILICDIFDKRVNNKIESKDVYAIPIDWKLVQQSKNNYNNIRINNHIETKWCIDVGTEVYLKIYLLNIRKRMNDIPLLSNYINNGDYKEKYAKIKRFDIEKTQEGVISKKIFGLTEKVAKLGLFN